MPTDWIDVTDLSFNVLLLLERTLLSLFPGWLPEAELAVALYANPAVEWYLRHKCPALNPWLDKVTTQHSAAGAASPQQVRRAELKVMREIDDLLTYTLDPDSYDRQPFTGWDSRELSEMLDFAGKTVLDIGAGTGRLTFIAAEKAETVFAVDPAESMRRYIKDKAKKLGLRNIFAVDGLIDDIPFPNNFADVVIAGHVFGSQPEQDYKELMRVLKPGGMLILCPGNYDRDNERHDYLMAQGFAWSRFEEPGDGYKRKYWRRKEG